MAAFLLPLLYGCWMLFSGRRLRIPFELLWPAVLLAALAPVHLLFPGGGLTTLRIIALCAVFVIVVALARKRDVIRRILWLSLASSGGVAALSVACRAGWIFPTAYDLNTGIVLAGPHSVDGGLFMFLSAVLSCLPLSLIHPRRKGLVIACGLLLSSAFLLLVLPLRNREYALVAAHAPFLWPTVLPTLVLLWLAARIVAKAMVAYREKADRVCLACAIALAAGTAVALTAGVMPGHGHVLLAAAGAAWLLPEGKEGANPRLAPWAFLPLVLLIVVNLCVVFPGDPRDYETKARAALRHRDYMGARKHLDFFRQRIPEESRIDYYLALTFLEEGRLDTAAASFRSSLRPSPSTIRPGITDAEKGYFLMRMRDLSSALPETLRGFAYERCLISVGRERHALSLLELRGTAAPPLDMNPQPLARALAHLLDAPSLVGTFLKWEPRLLATILASAGPYNRICEVAVDFPRGQLPLVVSARAASDSVSLTAYGTFGVTGAILFPRPAVMGDVSTLFPSSGWDEWRPHSDKTWVLPYGALGELRLSASPEFRFRKSAGAAVDAQEEAPAQLLIFLPGNGEPL